MARSKKKVSDRAEKPAEPPRRSTRVKCPTLASNQVADYQWDSATKCMAFRGVVDLTGKTLPIQKISEDVSQKGDTEKYPSTAHYDAWHHRSEAIAAMRAVSNSPRVSYKRLFGGKEPKKKDVEKPKETTISPEGKKENDTAAASKTAESKKGHEPARLAVRIPDTGGKVKKPSQVPGPVAGRKASAKKNAVTVREDSVDSMQNDLRRRIQNARSSNSARVSSQTEPRKSGPSSDAAKKLSVSVKKPVVKRKPRRALKVTDGFPLMLTAPPSPKRIPRKLSNPPKKSKSPPKVVKDGSVQKKRGRPPKSELVKKSSTLLLAVQKEKQPESDKVETPPEPVVRTSDLVSAKTVLGDNSAPNPVMDQPTDLASGQEIEQMNDGMDSFVATEFTDDELCNRSGEKASPEDKVKYLQLVDNKTVEAGYMTMTAGERRGRQQNDKDVQLTMFIHKGRAKVHMWANLGECCELGETGVITIAPGRFYDIESIGREDLALFYVRSRVTPRSSDGSS